MTYNCNFWGNPQVSAYTDKAANYSIFPSSSEQYYNSDLSIWLSVDPMSDRYPNLSPYTYCADNPVRIFDPNGEEIMHCDGELGINIRNYKADLNLLGGPLDKFWQLMHKLENAVEGHADNSKWEGHNDGANTGKITKHDVEVGTAVIATIVSAGAAAEAETAIAGITSAVSLINNIDDVTVNSSGQTFSQRVTENNPTAQSAVNGVKIVSPLASIATSTGSIAKNGIEKAATGVADVAVSFYGFVKSITSIYGDSDNNKKNKR